MTSFAERLLLGLRVATEVGIVAAFAAWGVHVGGGAVSKVLLGIGVPVVGFGFWGAVDFRQARRLAEPLRLLQELAVSLLAAVALYAVGEHVLCFALAAVTLVYYALVYATGRRLLRPATSGDSVVSGTKMGGATSGRGFHRPGSSRDQPRVGAGRARR
jgi:hypothetical protein